MSFVRSPERLSAFSIEFALANDLYASGDFDRSYYHAGRAHVLGQPWATRHTAAHWLMFKIGVSRIDGREVWGQIVRMAGGGFLSLAGKLPAGNTGGANVPAEEPMAYPADLKALCEPDQGL
jgi:hypothetical protein